jgi:hypothetical protein
MESYFRKCGGGVRSPRWRSLRQLPQLQSTYHDHLPHGYERSLASNVWVYPHLKPSALAMAGCGCFLAERQEEHQLRLDGPTGFSLNQYQP